MERFRYIINLLIIAMLLLTVAINRNGKIAGTAVDNILHPQQLPFISNERQSPDGTTIVNSINLANDISGFGGATPVEVHIKDGTITKIDILENSETADFLNTTIKSGLTERWIGLTLDEALKLRVDGVSGATLTSQSLIATISRTLEYTTNTTSQTTSQSLSIKSIIGVLVILLGIIISFVAKSGVWRVVQLGLNVVVLGFWCSSFLSLSILVNWLSNGINLVVAIIPFTLLLSATILPFFGKKGHYCTWHCPLGSLQELASKCNKRKIAIPPRLLKYLNYLRESLLLGLLFMMWLGVGFSLIDYELFSAFMFSSANIVVVIVALLFIILSIFIQRPYCRFICPTGALLKFSTNTKLS